MDAEIVKVEQSTSSVGKPLVLRCEHHRSLDINFTCNLSLERDSNLSQWRIAVTIDTRYGVCGIRYPVVVAPKMFGQADEDDRFICGSFGWEILPRPWQTINQHLHLGGHWWCRAKQYPGPVAFQMQAYYDETASLYRATYDDKGCVKAFGMEPRGQAIDFSIEHNYDETPQLSYELPYDTVLGVFHGDWYTAADIYIIAAHKQHWCS